MADPTPDAEDDLSPANLTDPAPSADNQTKMTLALKKKIVAGFAVSALVLIAIGGFAYLSVREYAKNSQLISRTREVLEGLQEIESSARGPELST